MESYDEVPYPGSPYRLTHPVHLGAIAVLFGLDPVSPARARVLELGCGDGENLVPMALAAPGGTFVGIDLAATAVERGRALVRSLGLENVDLRHGDLREVTPEWGPFDYVIAHGVWSWVPEAVQRRIFEVLRDVLAPHGVAFVSYDVLPGAHLRNLARDLMRWHARDGKDERTRIAAAREILSLVAPPDGPSSPYHVALRAEAEAQARRSDGVLAHDDLADSHVAVYFHDFVGRAAAHGLAFLAEAELVAMNPARAPRVLREQLPRIAPGRVEREQYLDFVQGRRFRQTLLCRAEAPLAEETQAERVAGLHAATRAATDAGEADLLSDRPVRFGFPKEGSVEVWHPVAKLALDELSRRWPETLPMPELVERVRARRGAASEDDPVVVQESLLALHAAALVELQFEPSAARARPGERPRASALARRQIEQGRSVTTLRHERVQIGDALAAKLLSLLDGSRDEAALLAALASAALAGEIEGIAPQSVGPDVLRESLAETLPAALARLADLALLEG
jgi:SAM-dependent methyltransferase